MILTIEIPEALVDQLREEAAERGEDLNNYAVAKLAQPLFFEEDDEWDDVNEAGEPNEDLIAALREGLADADAGRTVSLEEMDARIREGLAARNSQKPEMASGSI